METPRQTVSSFDHFVTQWMSTVISSLGNAWNSAQLHPRASSISPTTEKFQTSIDRCGVTPAESTGKSEVRYWPGGILLATSGCGRPWKPRETDDISRLR